MSLAWSRGLVGHVKRRGNRERRRFIDCGIQSDLKWKTHREYRHPARGFLESPCLPSSVAFQSFREAVQSSKDQRSDQRSEKQPNYCQPTKKNIILFPGHHVVVVGVLQSIFYLSREKNPIQFGRRGAFLRPLRRLSVKRTAYDHPDETEERGFVLFRSDKEFI